MNQQIIVESPNVNYSNDFIESSYAYQGTRVTTEDGVHRLKPYSVNYNFRTARQVPKLGVMLVGLSGNNGSTCVAGTLANKHGLTWRTKSGEKSPNYFGSITQASTISLGVDADGNEIFAPLNSVIPMVHPNDFVWGGWDISKTNLADAMERAGVLDYDLQRQLRPLMQDIVPLPSVYDPSFIAANQASRADNVIIGTKQEQVDQLRKDIREFKERNTVDKVIILWTANTERYSDIVEGLNDTADNLLQSIRSNEKEISPSTLFAVASILEGVAFINGSPQNTFVPGALELALRHNVPIAGDDFKSGQTKFKSVLVDFLISSGIKPRSIVSYNHLGNNDGKNLSAPQTFKSKEISKSGVVEDMVSSNPILYAPGERPDHCIVIKYIPYVGDSKRAMDEYVSEIFMGGHSTIIVHNTCEDSLLAAPIIYDLVILAELTQRISYKAAEGARSDATLSEASYESLHPVLSILAFLCKAPLVPEGAPVINALFKQRAAIDNLLRACVGLPPENNMRLETYAAYTGRRE